MPFFLSEEFEHIVNNFSLPLTFDLKMSIISSVNLYDGVHSADLEVKS